MAYHDAGLQSKEMAILQTKIVALKNSLKISSVTFLLFLAISRRIMSIGFVGLGKMGAAMAPQLVKSGHQVVGHDLVPPSASLVGFEFAADLAALVDCTTIITMLPDGDAVEAVVHSLLSHGCRAAFIDMSSSHPMSAVAFMLALSATANPLSTRQYPAELRVPGTRICRSW